MHKLLILLLVSGTAFSETRQVLISKEIRSGVEKKEFRAEQSANRSFAVGVSLFRLGVNGATGGGIGASIIPKLGHKKYFELKLPFTASGSILSKLKHSSAFMLYEVGLAPTLKMWSLLIEPSIGFRLLGASRQVGLKPEHSLSGPVSKIAFGIKF